jgi:hypothetical protein
MGLVHVTFSHEYVQVPIGPCCRVWIDLPGKSQALHNDGFHPALLEYLQYLPQGRFELDGLEETVTELLAHCLHDGFRRLGHGFQVVNAPPEKWNDAVGIEGGQQLFPLTNRPFRCARRFAPQERADIGRQLRREAYKRNSS